MHGLEFGEYTSRTFYEEASKQRRYTYGLFEMVFNGTVKLKTIKKSDLLYTIIFAGNSTYGYVA